MEIRSTITRRRFVALYGAATAAATLLAACGAPAPSAPTSAPAAAGAAPAPGQPGAPPAVKPTQFKEAPLLADLVKQGKLPPVAQRLPPAPLVVTPTNKVGKYGGMLRGEALAPETTNDLQGGMVVGLFAY